jgi:hypothetical protein
VGATERPAAARQLGPRKSGVTLLGPLRLPELHGRPNAELPHRPREQNADSTWREALPTLSPVRAPQPAASDTAAMTRASPIRRADLCTSAALLLCGLCRKAAVSDFGTRILESAGLFGALLILP